MGRSGGWVDIIDPNKNKYGVVRDGVVLTYFDCYQHARDYVFSILDGCGSDDFEYLRNGSIKIVAVLGESEAVQPVCHIDPRDKMIIRIGETQIWDILRNVFMKHRVSWWGDEHE